MKGFFIYLSDDLSNQNKAESHFVNYFVNYAKIDVL
jgi:hypothetical protein